MTSLLYSLNYIVRKNKLDCTIQLVGYDYVISPYQLHIENYLSKHKYTYEVGENCIIIRNFVDPDVNLIIDRFVYQSWGLEFLTTTQTIVSFKYAISFMLNMEKAYPKIALEEGKTYRKYTILNGNSIIGDNIIIEEE